MAGATRVRIDLLCPVELFVDGEPVPVGRTQVRKLLAILGARTQTSTSTDQLVEALWANGDLPADPRAALSIGMSRLRTTLGDARDAVISDDRGHRIDADVDIDRFDSLIASSRATDDLNVRIAQLEAALGLWRGTPLAEVDADLLTPVVNRLEEERWFGATTLVETLAATGRSEAAIAWATPLHDEQPHRERLAIALAGALAADGRRSDALAVVERTRSTLRESMGLDPSAALEAVEADVLSGSVDLRPPSSMPAVVDGDTFVGRRAELDALAQARPGVRAVVGEPGIGKSSLLRHAADEHRARGATVVAGTASPTPERPLDCVASLLEQLVPLSPPAPDDDLARASLSRIIDGVEPSGAQVHAVTRQTMIEAVADYIGDAAPADEVVLVVDDCQWLDQGSAEVLRRIADEGRCSVLAGLRPGGPPQVEFLTDPGADGVETMALGPLGESDATALVASQLGTRGEREAAGLFRRSGGNPLFLSLLVELLAEGIQANGELPSTVLVAVGRRLDALSSNARDTLQLAAAVGEAVPLGVLRQLTTTAERDVEEAAAAHVLVVDPTTDEAHFAHALVAEGAYQLLSAGRRVMVHDQIGTILESIGAPATEYVRHFEEAASLDPRRAAIAHRDAAEAYALTYSWDLVEQHATAGLDHLPDASDLLEAELAVLNGRAQRLLHRGDSVDALKRGAAHARRLGEDELFAEAAVALSVQQWSMTGDVDPDATELLEEALGLDLAPRQRAMVCAAGATLAMSAHHARARELYHEAMDLALASDDPSLQAAVLRNCRWGLSHPADFGTLAEATELLTDLAGSDFDYRWGAAANRFAVGTISGDLDVVDGAVAELRQMHASLGPSPRDWEMSHVEASYAHLTGDLGEADRWLDRTFELASQTTSASWMTPIYGALLVALRRAQGRLGEVEPFIEGAVAGNPDFLGWRSAAAAINWAAGDASRAREHLDFVARHDFADLVPDQTWSAVTVLLADVIHALDDRGRAEALYRVLSPYAGRMSWSGVGTLGPIDSSLALLAETTGDGDTAAGHAAVGDDLASRFGRVPADR